MSSSHHSGVKGSEWGRERRAERQEMVEETMATRMEDRGRTARWYSSGGEDGLPAVDAGVQGLVCQLSPQRKSSKVCLQKNPGVI